MLIRHAALDDAAGCLAVYAPYADDTAVSFELHAPVLEDYRERIARISNTHAFLVIEHGEDIAGFAYAGVHRERLAYRWTCEVSVYLAPEFQRRGLGRALYGALFPLLQQQGYRVLLAGISVPNDPSVALHRSLGFETVGVYRRIGWKAGDWRDVMWLSLQMGPETHEAQLPPPPGPPVRLANVIELS
jgi:phosphinothricin acetyltransferase